MNIHRPEPPKSKPAASNILGSTNDLFQTFFAYEKHLTSEDLGQVVKSLSELKKIIKSSENKILLNSVVSKIISNFELVKNIHKFQYLEFFKELKPFFEGIQNKQEILDVTSKLLTSNDYIARIISTQLITLMKDYIEDRVDVLHNLMNVALSTQSQLEIRYLFKSFMELCEVSEAFSFTYLQQFRQIFDRFIIVIPKKKFVVLIQKAAKNISQEENLTILVQNAQNSLETDFQGLIDGTQSLDTIYSKIILLGNLLLYTHSQTAEIIPLVVNIFFFLTEYTIPKKPSQESPYFLCKLIINLFKKLFQIIPSLKTLLANELNQMINKVVGSNQFDKSTNNKIFLQIITMLGDDTPLDSMTDFFTNLPPDLKLKYLLQNGNKFQLSSNSLKGLLLNRVQAEQSEGIFLSEFQDQTATVKVMRSLNNQDILDLLKESKNRIIEKLKAQNINQQELHHLINFALLTIVSLNLNAQFTGDYPNNVFVILQGDISPLLASLKPLDGDLFNTFFKNIFLMILELGKMALSTTSNPHRFENSVLEHLKGLKSNFRKPLVYWMIQKTFINNYFILCRWLIQGFAASVSSEKIILWLDVIRNLCNIFSNECENSALQLLKTINSIRLIKSENTFSYQFLRCLYFLHSTFQQINISAHSKTSIEKPLLQVQTYLTQLRLLKDKFFIDDLSKVSLKTFIYSVEFMIALFEQTVENEDNPRGYDERLGILTKKIEKWLLYMPFHDGEIELMKTLRSFYKTGTSNNEWMTIGQDLLDSFLNFKVVCIPRAFLNFREPLDLKMRLVNQDDFFNKKTNEITTSASLSYVMDVRVHIHNLPKNMKKEKLSLQAEAITNFHHNLGSKDDIIHQVSRITQTYSIGSNQSQVEPSFLLHFNSIGKFTVKVTLNVVNKKSRVIYNKSETWLLNAF